VDRVYNFFNTIKGKFPNIVQFQVQPDVELISPSNGELNNVHSGGAKTTITGAAASGNFSGTTGAVITWRTGGVRNGRRVRGRTFLVPTSSILYDVDGTLNATSITDLQTAANALLATPTGGLQMGVWSRPSGIGATDGGFHPILSASVPDMAAVLRSRRG
jgi:hypothetical protein